MIYVKILTTCTLLMYVALVPISFPQEFQKCLTFSEEILNQGEMLVRPLKGRPETTITTDHFMVHFIDNEPYPNDPDATDYGYAAFVSAIAEQVWNKQVNQFGWPQPPGDGTIGGGTNKYDIYLLNLSDGYGYTRAENPVPGTNGYTSYVVVSTGIIKNLGDPWRPMTEDEIKATVAHEFNHALQDGLTWLAKQMNNNSWFYENTSTWMEEICYPEVDDWILTFVNNPNITTCLNKPYLPIDYFGSNTEQYQYSGALFCHTMSKWKGISIIKNIWLRAKNTTLNFVNDIDYVLNQNQTSLIDVLKRYAVWRYYTGDNDDGNHFDKASLMEGLHILREHNNGTGSGSSSPDNLNSRGGASYIVFKNADGVININFNGQNNTQFTAKGLNKRIYFPDVENNFTLNSSNDGTLNNISCIGEDYVILIPVITEWQTLQSNLTYTYSSVLGTGISTIFWTEKENTNITEGTLSVQLSQPIASGYSRGLNNLLDYREKTNFERFPNFQGKPVKHNNWNSINSKYFLVNDFQASTQNNRQSAKYNFLEPIKIQVLLESNLIPNKGSGSFQDPWYQLNDGSQPGTNYWINFISEYEPTGKEGASEKGVFLNQGTDWLPPYYSVKANLTQDITLYNTGNPSGRTHKFYFQNWGGSDVQYQNASALETGVVFTDVDPFFTPIAYALYKGTQLGGSYNTNGQRKAVKCQYQYYSPIYNVSESLGKVWLEASTDNGQTWRIENNGQPISGGAGGRCPSVHTSDGIYWVITFQELIPNSTSSKIKMVSYYNETQQINLVGEFVISNSSTLNLNPITNLGNDMTILTTYEQNGTINCRFGFWYLINPYPHIVAAWSMNTYQLFGNNYSNSSLTVGSECSPCSTKYHLVATRNTTYDRADIVYKKFRIQRAYVSPTGGTPPFCDIPNVNDPNCAWPVEEITELVVSQRSGYPYNYLPSISLAGGVYPIVSWTAGVWTGGPIYYKRSVTRRGPSSGTTWGAFQITGNNVNYSNNNSVSQGTSEKTVIVWSEGNEGTPQVTKWIKRTGTSYITPQSLSHSGIQTQVISGSDYQYMTAMVFNNNMLPYYFIKSTTDFSYVPPQDVGGGLSKITESDTILTFGRSGIADINGIEFVFNIGDILVGDSIINFIEKPDTLLYSSAEDLNQSTRTVDFHLNSNTLFLFTNFYEVVQKANPDTALTENDAVNFKAELVNATTGNVVGTFDNITYNKNNLEKYASIDYEVDCSGITPGDYYLRLVTTVSGEAEYSLANVVNDNTTLAKKKYNRVNFKGSEIPLTYALEQNYPNPFNPATIIRYQLPKDGMVTLKVYDILGAEVTTLVNEEKIAGRYEVNFNASALASGVYIYRLNVNDPSTSSGQGYVSVKKMVLLK